MRAARRVSAQELHSLDSRGPEMVMFQRWHVTCQSNSMSH